MSKFKLLQEFISKTLIVLASTIFLFFGINMAIVVISFFVPSVLKYPPRIKEQTELPVSSLGMFAYDYDKLKTLYAHYTQNDLVWLILESANIRIVYDTNTLFREDTFEGKFINVDHHGFRHGKNQGPWPIEDCFFNIFVFGGSTTFGYNESDENTISSSLQEYLRDQTQKPVMVYNFGRGFYYSSLEKILLENLLQYKIHPNLVVFLDGLNEFYWYDYHDHFLRENNKQLAVKKWFLKEPPMRSKSADPAFFDLWIANRNRWSFPLSRFVYNLIPPPPSLKPRDYGDSLVNLPHPPPQDTSTNREIIKRWFENLRSLQFQLSSQKIDSVFAIQPIPTYAHDFSRNRLYQNLDQFGPHIRSHYGYELLFSSFSEDICHSNLLDLSRVESSFLGTPYLDIVHYSHEFSAFIAKHIADHILASSQNLSSFTEKPKPIRINKNNIVAEYRFDSNFRDTSSNRRDAIPHQVCLTIDRFGNPLSACQINPTLTTTHESYLRLPDFLLNGLSKMTLSLWVKEESSENADNKVYVCFGTTPGKLTAIVHRENTLEFLITTHATTHKNKIPFNGGWTNQYQHYAMTYDNNSGEFRIYINGLQVAIQIIPNGIIQNEAFSSLGGYSFENKVQSFFSGNIDDFVVYNQVLNESQIRFLYLHQSSHSGRNNYLDLSLK